MKHFLSVIYYLGLGVFGLVALLGVTVASAAMVVAFIIGVAVMITLAVPVLAWCAIFESSSTISVVNSVRNALKTPSPKAAEAN